jgi:hypothetical protein
MPAFINLYVYPLWQAGYFFFPGEVHGEGNGQDTLFSGREREGPGDAIQCILFLW